MRLVRVEYGMRASVAGTLEAVEEFLGEFRRRLETLAGCADGFAAELLLREALTNAVVHGCRGDSSKQVRCVLRLRGRQLTIAVRDPGAGFDWHAFRQCAARRFSPSGRGVEIARRYATRIRFNDKGNAVTMIKRFSEVGR